MLVRHVMNKSVVTAKPELTLKEASAVMTKLHIGSLVVMEGKKILGIITNSDIIKAIAVSKGVESTTVTDIMSKNVIKVEPDKELEDAVDLMIKNKIKKLPVVDGNKLIGIITTSDIIVVEPKLIASIADLVSIKLPGYRGG